MAKSITVDKSKRKEIIEAYKNKLPTGGVYCITCSGNQRKLIKSTMEMESAKSRFDFAMKIESCPEPSMQREWNDYGMESFSFTCLEELKMEETQTQREYRNDIKALYDIWKEKLSD